MSLTGLKSRSWQGCVPFWRLHTGENLFPRLVQLPEAACVPWLVAPVFVFAAGRGEWLFSHIIPPTSASTITSLALISLLLPFPLLKTLVITPGPPG